MPEPTMQVIIPAPLIAADAPDGETLCVVFYPLRLQRMTGALERLAHLPEEGWPERIIALQAMLTEVLASWDVFDNDEVTPIPITLAWLQRLPAALTLVIFRYICAALYTRLKGDSG